MFPFFGKIYFDVSVVLQERPRITMQNSPTIATITNEYLSVLFINNTKSIQRHKSNVSGKHKKADKNYGKTLYIGVKRLLNRIKRSINGGNKARIGISWQPFKRTNKRKVKRKFGLVNYFLQLKTKKNPYTCKV